MVANAARINNSAARNLVLIQCKKNELDFI